MDKRTLSWTVASAFAVMGLLALVRAGKADRSAPTSPQAPATAPVSPGVDVELNAATSKATPDEASRSDTSQARRVSTTTPTEPRQAAQVLAPVFDLFDCDRMGVIDTGQVDEHMFDLFRPADRDRSHRLSFSEFEHTVRQADPETRKQLFETADTNGDQALTAHEYKQHLYTMIELADSNQDSEVSQAELAELGSPVAGAQPLVQR